MSRSDFLAQNLPRTAAPVTKAFGDFSDPGLVKTLNFGVLHATEDVVLEYVYLDIIAFVLAVPGVVTVEIGEDSTPDTDAIIPATTATAGLKLALAPPREQTVAGVSRAVIPAGANLKIGRAHV